jgi:hypothetical protein
MTAPTLVVPGSGGLDLDGNYSRRLALTPQSWGIPTASGDWVVNPRGLRPKSVHQDVFFAAIPEILTQHPIPASSALAWLATPRLKHGSKPMASGKIPTCCPNSPSPSCGPCSKGLPRFSFHPAAMMARPTRCWRPWLAAVSRWWVISNLCENGLTPGKNGLLVDPHNPQELAAAICQALDDPNLRQAAADHNLDLVSQRAGQSATRPQIDLFTGNSSANPLHLSLISPNMESHPKNRIPFHSSPLVLYFSSHFIYLIHSNPFIIIPTI